MEFPDPDTNNPFIGLIDPMERLRVKIMNYTEDNTEYLNIFDDPPEELSIPIEDEVDIMAALQRGEMTWTVDPIVDAPTIWN